MSGVMWEIGETCSFDVFGKRGTVIDHVFAGVVDEDVIAKRGGAVLLEHLKGLCLLVSQEQWADTVGIVSWVTNQIRGWTDEG